jgi:uncharacterized protein with ParB-like and HNH nuclease domain
MMGNVDGSYINKDGNFFGSMTIAEAIENINHNTFLLPAWQRRFTWTEKQITNLFDSMMQGYPINTFMFWNINSDNEIISKLKFYRFLSKYVEKIEESNVHHETLGSNDFVAVVDGQQRLNAIYLGLMGTFATKKPHARWKDSPENFPERRLFINLGEVIDGDEGDVLDLKYKFVFKNPKSSDDFRNEIWFEVRKIYTYTSIDELKIYITENFAKNKIAGETLLRLWTVMFEEKNINYYSINEQRANKVLDMFIRTNSGGTTLRHSDLLMSMILARTSEDFREKINRLVNSVRQDTSGEFMIDHKLILKFCLFLHGDDIKFELENFKDATIDKIIEDWDNIHTSIFTSFELVDNLRFNDKTLSAKNAIIPIAYYLHKNINNKAGFIADGRHFEERKQIKKWLCISLLKGVFGRSSDSLLSDLKTCIDEFDNCFSYYDIAKKFKNDLNKNLDLSDDNIISLLGEEYGNTKTRVILGLLFPESGLEFDTIDHLHAQKIFENSKVSDFNTLDDFEFCKNNQNTIPNLRLLARGENSSKNKRSLQDWVENHNGELKKWLIPKSDDYSLYELKNFKIFIEKRKELLKEKLKENIGL